MLPRRVKIYAAAVPVAAGLLLAGWYRAYPSALPLDPRVWLTWPLPLTFAALIAVAVNLPLRLGRSYKITVDTAVDVAALLLCGPPVAMIVTGLGNAAGFLALMARRQRDGWNTVFNTGQAILSMGLAGAVYLALAPSGVSLSGPWTTWASAPLLDTPRDLLAMVFAAGTLYVVNSVAVAIAVGLQHRRSPLSVFLDGWRIECAQSLALVLVGMLTALLMQQHPSTLAVLVLLMGAVHMSMRQQLALLARAEEAHALTEAARASAEAEVQARGEFLSVAAHELRTPVTSVRGYAQLLLRKCSQSQAYDPAKLVRALQAIDQQSDRLTRLVAQLLDISRIQAGTLDLEPAPVDLSALVEDVAALHRAMHTHPLTVIAAPDVQVIADALRLEQVLVNLLDNAVKYSVDDLPIELSVSLAADGSDGGAEITVRDRGIGIPAEHQHHVFERFYQVNGSVHSGGMGLGLYISRQIVEAHGGTIAVQTPEGGGTRFVVRLPAVPPGHVTRPTDVSATPLGQRVPGAATALPIASPTVTEAVPRVAA